MVHWRDMNEKRVWLSWGELGGDFKHLLQYGEKHIHLQGKVKNRALRLQGKVKNGTLRDKGPDIPVLWTFSNLLHEWKEGVHATIKLHFPHIFQWLHKVQGIGNHSHAVQWRLGQGYVSIYTKAKLSMLNCNTFTTCEVGTYYYSCLRIGQLGDLASEWLVGRTKNRTQ